MQSSSNALLDITSTADDVHERSGVTPHRPTPHLFVVLEADRPWAGGSRHSLAGVSEVWIARTDTRMHVRDASGLQEHLTIGLPARTLSSNHVRLANVAGAWTLEDAGSRNGTFVNGVRAQQATLADGDLIEAGHCFFIYRAALPTRTDAPRDSIGPDRSELGLATLLPEEAERLNVLVEIAATRLPVLLLGESGTGKELLARAIHQHSRRPGRLVAVNCGAIADTLVESLLFGHVRGAFSGAVRDEPGFIRSADGGTLFLDEVADLSMAAQSALLRVLQDGQVTPVGTAQSRAVDFRVVAATHRPLRAMVETGEFRADLLARLDGHTHQLPPLRDRREDLGLLLRDLLVRHGASRDLRLSVEGARELIGRSFALNVRELEHALSRGVALARDGAIRAEHLRPNVPAGRTSSGPPGATTSSVPPSRTLSSRDEELRRELEGLLVTHRGNVAEVARAMGKARMQIHRWVKRFGLDLSAPRSGARRT